MGDDSIAKRGTSRPPHADRLHRLDWLSNTAAGGLTVFVLCWSFVLASKFTRALDTAETLTRDLEAKVAERTRALEEANAKLAMAAARDPLTSVYSRRELEKVIHIESEKSHRGSATQYSVLFLDLDGFKGFNLHQRDCSTVGITLPQVALFDVNNPKPA